MIRAIIVDDELPSRERMRHLLNGTGVEVIGEAADGEAAIAQAAALGPDVLFLDIQMPALSGLDVVSRLAPPHPRIVFCTAFDQYAIEAFDRHAVDYLLKPVNRDRLLRTIERLQREIGDERAVEEAARTHARLMPDARTVGALECAAICRPAQGVGGDYYDILPAGEQRAALVVADISGKGLYAGILAAALQARLQAVIAGGAADPGRVLTALNRLTAGRMDDHRFATVVLGIHDPVTSTICFAGAGHPPAFVLSRDGASRTVASSGAAIGWMATPFAYEAIDVRRDDLVALYSDGLSETTDGGGSELGTDGVLAILQRHHHRPVADLVRAAMADVAAFARGAPAGDDRTLLVARVL